MTFDKDIKEFCKNSGIFSIPLIQIEFSVTYKEAARVVDELVGTGEALPLSDELSYEYVSKESVASSNSRKAEDFSSASESGDVESKYMEFRKRHTREQNDKIKRQERDEDEDDEDDEDDEATMNRRRREYLERRRRELIARLQEDMDENKDDDNDLFSDDDDDYEEDDSYDGEKLQSKLIEILTSENEFGKLLAKALKLCVSEGNIYDEMLSRHLNIQKTVAYEVCFWLYINDFIEKDENKGYKLAVPEALFYSCCIEARERKEHVGTLVDVLKRITEQKQREEEDSKIKALILSDISLNRAKAIVKAQGCLMAVQDADNDIYVSIYKNIIYKLSNMSDYTFNKLKKQLSG